MIEDKPVDRFSKLEIDTYEESLAKFRERVEAHHRALEEQRRKAAEAGVAPFGAPKDPQVPLGRKTCRKCGSVSFDLVSNCPECSADTWWT